MITSFKLELAMQINSKDKTVRSKAVQCLKMFISQFLSVQAIKVEHLVSMMPAVKKAFDLMGDDKLGLPTKKESLKTEKGSHDKKSVRRI